MYTKRKNCAAGWIENVLPVLAGIVYVSTISQFVPFDDCWSERPSVADAWLEKIETVIEPKSFTCSDVPVNTASALRFEVVEFAVETIAGVERMDATMTVPEMEGVPVMFKDPDTDWLPLGIETMEPVTRAIREDVWRTAITEDELDESEKLGVPIIDALIDLSGLIPKIELPPPPYTSICWYCRPLTASAATDATPVPTLIGIDIYDVGLLTKVHIEDVGFSISVHPVVTDVTMPPVTLVMAISSPKGCASPIDVTTDDSVGFVTFVHAIF